MKLVHYLVPAMVVSLAVACGDDDDGDTTPGTGGSAGMTGSGGSAGAATGGSGGSTGGSAGAGTGGSAGAGTGGSAGAGTGGSAGAGTGGTAGAGTGGAGGMAAGGMGGMMNMPFSLCSACANPMGCPATPAQNGANCMGDRACFYCRNGAAPFLRVQCVMGNQSRSMVNMCPAPMP